MSAEHFHVMAGNPGCMPDANAIYEDFGSAFSAASEAADGFYGDATCWWVEGEDRENEYALFQMSRGSNPFPTATVEVVKCHDVQCEEVMFD